MSNKDIEKNIKILKNITKQDFSNPMGWTGYYDSELKELQQAIENILEDRERYKKLYERALSDLVVADAKANKYDRLVERIKEIMQEHIINYNNTSTRRDYWKGSIDTDREILKLLEGE